MRAALFSFFFSLISAVCAAETPKILVMGDSLIATNVLSGRAIPNVLTKELGVPVTNVSLTGKWVRGISRQYKNDDWDWVIVNGGGNDLMWGCGCNKCDLRLQTLISPSGDLGQIPSMVAKIRQSGAKVIYVGYLRSPGLGSPIERCRDEGDVLEARIQTMAERDKNVFFLSNADLVPYGDKSYHGFDRVHPSVKGSAAIAKRIAKLMRSEAPKGTFAK